MTIFIELLFLTLGFVILIKGADILIDHSVIIAEKLKLSPLVIGILVVSVGTSIPEFIVSVVASLEMQHSDLIVGNVIGSNVANILLVLGLLAILVKIPIQKNNLKESLLFNYLAIGLLLIFGFFFNSLNQVLHFSRIESGIFLVIFFIFIIRNLSKRKKVDFNDSKITSEIKEKKLEQANQNPSVLVSIFYIVLSVLFLSWGGDQVVEGAIFFAREVFQVSDGFVGLTIIAIGTSLPEVVTSLLAGQKQKVDLALGNVLGSNLFNFLLVLSVASLIRPLTFSPYFLIDILVSLFSLLFLGVIVFFSSKIKTIDYKLGVVLLSTYFVYLVFIYFRG